MDLESTALVKVSLLPLLMTLLYMLTRHCIAANCSTTILVGKVIAYISLKLQSLFLVGVPPDIDEGKHIERPTNITEGNKTVKIGSPVYVLNGYNVTIICTTVNGTPPISIMWELNGESIDGDANNNYSITITNPNNTDIITCRAHNNIGSDDEHTKIKTHGRESRGQEEAACTRVLWLTRPLQ